MEADFIPQDRTKVILQPSGLKAEVLKWHEDCATVILPRGAIVDIKLENLDWAEKPNSTEPLNVS